MKLLLLGLLLWLAAVLVSAWSLMLAVGVAHLEWWPLMPTMSYGTATAISFALSAPVLAIRLLISAGEAVLS